MEVGKRLKIVTVRVRLPPPVPLCFGSPMEVGDRLRPYTVWVRIPPEVPNMEAYRNGYNGVDLKSNVSA